MRRSILCCTAALLLLVWPGMTFAQETPSPDYFQFNDQQSLPRAVSEPVLLRKDAALYVLDREEQTLFIMESDDKPWRDLPLMAFSPVAAVIVGDHLICLSAAEDGAGGQAVHRLTLSGAAASDKPPLPALPAPLGNVAAAALGSRLYVAGNAGNSSSILVLDLADDAPQWQRLPDAAPGPLVDPFLATLQGVLYLFSDRTAAETMADGYVFADNAWRALPAAPFALKRVLAASCGDSHIVVLSEDSREVLGYHYISDTWSVLGALPDDLVPIAIVPDVTKFTMIAGARVVQGEAVLKPTKYGWMDHSVVGIYALGMLGIGAALARRERSSRDYFRGGQRVPWWASGMSLFATGASAISLMAMPGKAYAGNWAYLTGSFYAWLALPLVVFVYVPLARRLNVATANEFLERRFNLSIRMICSVIFSLNQMLGRMATIMLLPAIALSAVIGIPMHISILIMGVVTTAYVTLGGLEAVIWTDVAQALVMLTTVVGCTIWALVGLDTDIPTAIQSASAEGKLHMFDFSPNIIEPTVLVMFLSMFVATIAQIGDQNFIQRVQCTPDEKQARKAVVTQLAVAVPLNCVLFILGTALYLFYRERPELLSPALKTDGIYPLFAAQNLPSGLAGLVVAALLAATMSTLSSAVNSVANLGVEDFYRRLYPRATDRGALVLGKVLSVLLGVFGTGAALLLARSTLMSIWDLATLVTGMIAAPVTGIFLLGVFTRRASAGGVLVGSLAAIASTIYVRYYTDVHIFTYLAVGVTVCVAVGYLASLVFPGELKDISGLTVYSLLKPTADGRNSDNSTSTT